jgi:hypothetical protein
MWQQASDWALRRLLKALLKRHLKALLATELDVEQLRVSLGRGSLELRDVLLSPEWLAQHAVRGGWEGGRWPERLGDHAREAAQLCTHRAA